MMAAIYFDPKESAPMKMHITLLALITMLVAAPAFAAPQAMDNVSGMHHDAAPIDSIQWPAMTMAFKVASPELLEGVKVGDKVQFGLHPAGMNSTVTSIKPVQP